MSSSLQQNLTSHPLVSIIVTTTLLILLYLPRHFHPFLLSPVPISTLLLLLALLRLGTTQQHQQEQHPASSPQLNPVEPVIEPHKQEEQEEEEEEEEEETEEEKEEEPQSHRWEKEEEEDGSFDGQSDAKTTYGWCRGGPLEVIYEDYEGEEEYEESSSKYVGNKLGDRNGNGEINIGELGCVLPTSCYYFSEDSGSTEEGLDSPERSCFWWADEDEEEMIEIVLEEDNLIEIDLSTHR